ncbi:MAG: cytochrome c biogenesis protein CcsA [Desulfobacteraceae bacterium]|nr:cytochrome c biogenesis protein CcsA [Desulfobacteraceae bacterium]
MISVALFLYILSFCFYVISQVQNNPFYRRPGFFLLVLGFMCTGINLFLDAVSIGHIPAFGIRNSLVIFAFSVSFFFVLLYLRFKVDLLGGAVAAFSGLLTGLALFFDKIQYIGQKDFSIFMTALHVFFTFFANAAFFTACVIGLFYLVQEKNIKLKKHGIIFRRLPSLEILESSGNFCIAWGFFFLTVGLGIGVVMSKQVFGHFLMLDAKEVWSFLVWFLYAALIHGRLSSRWRGRKAAVMAIIGFGIVVFSFIGINIFMDTSHGEYFMGNLIIRG